MVRRFSSTVDCKSQVKQSRMMSLVLSLTQNLHFIVLELCARPEYVQLLRQEIRSQEELDYESISSLPILDSFIKESVRLNPLDLSK